MTFKAKLAALSISLAAPALAQDVTLRMATAAPEGTIWQKQLDEIAAAISEETEGRVKIDMSANGIPPLADQNLDAYLISLLFFDDDLDVRSCVLDAMTEDYRAMLLPAGVRLLDWVEVGSSQISLFLV